MEKDYTKYPVLESRISVIVSKSLKRETGVVSVAWELSNAVSIFKKGDKPGTARQITTQVA